ncbi:hypothetical protein RGC28_02905 [Helicobacter pylori]|uniref:hypothetical protein n=1 Tax=Helicobacter pylori TaxID=210 RepID=UPI002928A07A|nr:hypothetical protein [Helicobacter pylori]MDU9764457.1 hypothetical protein [Helicobacter pylori]
MIVFCKAILGLLRGNGFKTLPIPYEVYYQTKFKKQVFKSGRMAKKPKIKKSQIKMGES